MHASSLQTCYDHSFVVHFVVVRLLTSSPTKVCASADAASMESVASVPAIGIGGKRRRSKKPDTIAERAASPTSSTAMSSDASAGNASFEFILWTPDGRLCKICGCKDTDPDPVCSEFPGRKWGYVVKVFKAKNTGLVCFYCMKVFEARYKIQHNMTVSKLPEWFARDQERMVTYIALVDHAIQVLKEQGNINGRVNWALYESSQSGKTLTVRKRSEMELAEPEDNWMYYKDYVDKFGDPASNQKGHTRQMVEGKDIVIIPGPRIGKLRRTQKIQADIDQVINKDESSLTGADELQSQQAAIFGSLNIAATGVSLDQLLAPAAPAGSAAQPLAIAASDAPCSEAGGGGFGFAVSQPVQLALPSVEPAPCNELLKTPDRGKRRGARTASATHANRAAASIPGGGSASTGAAAQSQKGSPSGSPKQPSTAPSGPQTAEARKRGRPTRDLCVVTDKVLQELKDSDEANNLFFGDGRVQQAKYMTRLLGDLKSYCSGLSDSALFEAANQRLRRLGAANEVLRVCTSKGCEHIDFAAAYDAQLHFLSMPPALDSDFPAHWRRGRHTLLARACKPEEFWTLVGKAALAGAGFADEDVVSTQVSIVEERIVAATKAHVGVDVEGILVELVKSEGYKHDELQLHKPLVDGLTALRTTLLHDNASIDTVKQALEQVGPSHSESCTVARALNLFPKGRAVLESIGSIMAKKEDTHVKLSEWSDRVKNGKENILQLRKTGADASDSYDVKKVLALLVDLNKFAEKCTEEQQQAMTNEFADDLLTLLAEARDVFVLAGFAQLIEKASTGTNIFYLQDSMDVIDKAGELTCLMSVCKDFSETFEASLENVLHLLGSLQALEEASCGSNELEAIHALQEGPCDVVKAILGEDRTAKYRRAMQSKVLQGKRDQITKSTVSELEPQAVELRDMIKPVSSFKFLDASVKDSSKYEAQLKMYCNLDISTLVNGLVEKAKHLGDERLHLQVVLIDTFVQLSSATASLEHLLCKAHSRNEISAAAGTECYKHLRRLIASHKLHKQVLESHRDRIPSAFASEDSRGKRKKTKHGDAADISDEVESCPMTVVHIKVLDLLIRDCPQVVSTVVEQAEMVLGKVREMWANDAIELSNKVTSWCPEAWEVSGDTLLDAPDVLNKLFSNQHYTKLGPACELLKTMKHAFTCLARDCDSPFISSEVMWHLKKALGHGSLTVTTTLVAFQLKSVIGKMANDDMKKGSGEGHEEAARGEGS